MANLLHLILILSVLCIFIPNSLEDGTACKEQIEMIVDCWLHYGEPPLCKRKSSMVLCAEERFDSVLNCSSITLRKIKRMVYSYGATEKVLCEDNADLQTELETRKPCWSILRSCALQVMMVEEDAAEEMCKDVMSLLSICTRISHSCNSVYTPFIKSVISASNCKQFRVIVDAAPTENSLTQLLKQSAGNNLSLGYAKFTIIFNIIVVIYSNYNC